MDLGNKRRYEACLATPPLWSQEHLRGMRQFVLTNEVAKFSSLTTGLPKRLGKLAEQFIFHQIRHQSAIQWVTDNLQIQQPDRSTLGELDALFYQGEQLIHLEVAYKFYLYDTMRDYSSPEAYWIGPNRNDTLVDKLEKLKTKQFPLLFHPLTQVHFQRLGIDTTQVKQQICLKAQLFLPANQLNKDITPLNQNCVMGFHLPFKQLTDLKAHMFYLPIKLDWLITPHDSVDWISYTELLVKITPQIEQQRSLMVWVKNALGEKLLKCFITCWEL